MAFKGNIPKGGHVEAELCVSGGTAGTALLAVAFVDNGNGSGAKSRTVAPGACDACDVQTNPQPTGLLRVVVDFNNNSDTGRLVVRVNNTIRNDEPITGDTTWSYSLA
jgi:hypothetical protein